MRPARTSAPIGPSTTRSQKRRRSGKLGNAVVDCLAPAADEAGEIADPRRQHRLDALAHAARHHRRGAAGADRDHDVAAIDDGRKNESRMREVVHHIDGQADRLGPRRHRRSDVAGARAQDRNHAVEIGRQRIALGELDPRRCRRPRARCTSWWPSVAYQRTRAPAAASRRNFARAEIAGADQQHRTGLQIEKYRQESHATLASPTSGLTGIIFYICLIQRPQRENYFFSIALQL